MAERFILIPGTEPDEIRPNFKLFGFERRRESGSLVAPRWPPVAIALVGICDKQPTDGDDGRDRRVPGGVAGKRRSDDADAETEQKTHQQQDEARRAACGGAARHNGLQLPTVK